MLVYHLDNYYKQCKLLINQKITSLPELNLSSICVLDKFSGQAPVVYVAIADNLSFEVYAGTVKDKQIQIMENVISVKEA
jgi:hypothetical protein